MAPKRTSRRTSGSIRRLPSGRYQARVRGVDGQREAAPTTFATKAEADRWIAVTIGDMTRGDWIDPRSGEITLAAYVEEWFHGKAALAPKTKEQYEYLLGRLVLPRLGQVELGKLSPARIRSWRADLINAGRPGPTTVAKAYRVLSGVLNTAVVDGRIVRNPCVEKGAGVERPKELKIATPAQVAQIAEEISPRYRAMVLMAGYAGLRWGELAGLRVRNLDLWEATVKVVEQVVELKTGQAIVREPKTAAGRRVVHLPAGLVEALTDHVKLYSQPGPDGLVFTSDRGDLIRSANFRTRHWLPAVAAVGLEGFRFHDLRHVAGTLATVSGATIREVQARLGHASPAAAYRYQHVLDNRDAEIADRLDAVMRSASGPSRGA